nr:aminomethyltransferase family protein [Rhizobium album]
MDDRRRTVARHVRLGHGPLRPLGGQGLHQGARARPVQPSFQDPLPQRGARRRTSRPYPPGLREAEGDGAVFDLNFGWEHPLRFSAAGEPKEETTGFTRQNWWASVGREARMLRENAGIIDISNFAKYAVKGPGPADWLNALFANRMPTEVGRSCLTPLIGRRGGIAGDFTVTKLAEDEFMIFGSGMAERYHQRFFKAVSLSEDTTFTSMTERLCAFNVAGPKSRELLMRLTNEDLANGSFPFMHSRRMSVAGIDVVALRVSFTGDLGWELYCDAGEQVALYDALLEAGRDLGAGPVGARALTSLRIEKGYGSWSCEYSPEYRPQESGLDRLIKIDKGAFLNKDAYANPEASQASTCAFA